MGDKIWAAHCGLFGGDEVFDRFNDDSLIISDSDGEFVLAQFLGERKTVPFELLYKLAQQMAIEASGDLIGKKTTFGDPEQYYDNALYAGEGKLQSLQNTLGKLVGELTEIGLIWHRRFKLCQLDDAKFIFILNRDAYQKILPEAKQIREEFFNKLVFFHLQALTINKIREYIWQEERQKSKLQFFSTKLSEKKLLAIKKVLVDCKGGQYGDDANYLEPISDDDWLYIFGRRGISNTEYPRWLSSCQNLSSTMQMICGKGKAIRPLIKVYFNLDVPRADIRVLPAILKGALEAIIIT